MNSPLRRLSRQYAAAFRRYLAGEQEAILQEAYELGREAIARGLGVMDMARVHQWALTSCLAPTPGEMRSRTLNAAESFFLETLSPFEATHRGFRKANLELRQLNAALAGINRQLEREVSERKRTEQALRESEAHHRQLFHQARTMQEDLRHLSNGILHAQEEERKRLSREVHDEVGQALTAISTHLEMLQRNGAVDPANLKRKIADAQTLFAHTMEAVHRFARELRPAMLDELGLLPTLRSYLQGFAERTGLRVRFKSAPEAERLTGEQKTVLFRVAQESLTNVAKHARASQVVVTFRKLKNGIQISIRDDGKAFQVGPQLSGNGKRRLGLLGMHERVRLVHGRFAVKSAPGAGTTVSVEIPFRRGDDFTAGKNIAACMKGPDHFLQPKKTNRNPLNQE